MFAKRRNTVPPAPVRRSSRQASPRSTKLTAGQPPAPRAFTLVEMLVAMAITLVMMAAVVTLFANVSNSVRNRRATIEMTNQQRHLRNVLQQDLQGATCPGVTWQRPDSNHGYIELIEGIQTDQNPTPLVRDFNNDKDFEDPNESQIDPALSPIPRNNIGADANQDGKITPQELESHYQQVGSLVPGALGDSDDILMLTVRNEREPFVGRVPSNVHDNGNSLNDYREWDYNTVESPLAEVVWFAIENPPEDDINQNFFGEPGMRTIYRRTFLIAPWLNPYRYTANNGNVDDVFSYDGEEFKAEPGLVRLLPERISLEQAIAAITAFQDQYDLSVRLEWDNNLEPPRWKIMANTLADLTKRENRFGHYGHGITTSGNPSRRYPYPMVSWGRGYEESDLEFVMDPEAGNPTTPAAAETQVSPPDELEHISTYTVTNAGLGYPVRPFVYPATESHQPATARAMLDDEGRVVRIIYGPAPLWGVRQGEDIMMTGVLGFDLRVYDPGAPLFGVRRDPTDANSPIDTVLQPSDPGWAAAYLFAPDNNASGNVRIGNDDTVYPLVGQGAYVDMGYRYNRLMLPPPYFFNPPIFANSASTQPWFFFPRGVMDVYGELLTPGYTVYDTWSFHYENNGLNEDQLSFDGTDWIAADTKADEGTDGFDDVDFRTTAPFNLFNPTDTYVLGADDAGERETVPPYDKPLRGMQVLIRTYEPDSRAIRQVRVNQHFLPE